MFENTVLNIELFNQFLFSPTPISREVTFQKQSTIFLDKPCKLTTRKHLRTKVTPDFHLTYSKIGEIWGRNQHDKNR